MKYIIVLGDGMADEPMALLGGKTALQAANTPHIDRLAQMGCSGMLDTIPPGMHPGSEIANLAVLGYNVPEVFEGRGVLEAASIGVILEPGDLALRCNLICTKEGRIKNHSAGHISSEEARQLITYLNEQLGSDSVKFYPGVSYRHLLVIKGGNKQLACAPPHDHMGEMYHNLMVKPLEEQSASTAALLNRLIESSQELLGGHPVNQERIAAGLDPANSIWPWSPGYKPQMPTLHELWGIQKSAVISAVDLIQGIGVLAGMEVIKVEGATGLYNTNYEGKAKATLDALHKSDLVYLHIEASDEAGHEGDALLKVKTIEYLDQRVVRTLLEVTSGWKEPVTIALLPDHPTPCALKTHTRAPVPFIIYTPGMEPDGVTEYNEFAAENGKFGLLKGPEFMQILLRAGK